MGPELFCVALCLLGTGPVDAGIIQTPRYHITQTGKKVVLQCSQDMDHFAMYWYLQHPGQGLRLIHYSDDSSSTTSGDASEGYSASRNKKDRFPLTLESASTNQTSLYFCASSNFTAMQSQLFSVQKGQPHV